MGNLYRAVIDRDNLNARVTLIDSGSFSIGLGLLVQHAARHAAESEPKPRKLAEHLRGQANNTFTLLTLGSVQALAERNRLTPSQAMLVDMLQFMPVYSLERGELAPFEKVRTWRGLLKVYGDFLEEFQTPTHIGLAYTQKPPAPYLYAMRKLMREVAPGCPLHIHPLPVLPPAIPPRLQTLIVVES